MIILLHVIIAITSLVSTTLSAFLPSKRRVYLSYVLIGLTLATGTYLVVTLHSTLLSVCETGLTYLAIALSGVGVAQYRLASVKQQDR